MAPLGLADRGGGDAAGQRYRAGGASADTTPADHPPLYSLRHKPNLLALLQTECQAPDLPAPTLSNRVSRPAPGLSHRKHLHMKFRPLHDRVVVRRLDAEQKTAGGIIIPDTAKEKPMEGEVVAAGPGVRNDRGDLVALDVKPGDRVLFGKWSGTEVKIEGEELLILKESDLMGVVETAP